MENDNIHTQLKTNTAEIHTLSEQHPLMQGFITGNYKNEHLLEFLVNILPLYQVVEQRLIANEILLNPDLKRSHLIELDINQLINDTGVKGIKISKITENWISDCWHKSVPFLKADLYVRWLADFFGGRILSKSLEPYNNMYKSSDPPSIIKTVRSIIERKESENDNADIIVESQEVFKYHIALFDEIWNQE